MKITSAVISGAVLKRNRPNLPKNLADMINVEIPTGWAFPDTHPLESYVVGTVYNFDLEEIYQIINHDILWLAGWTSDEYHTAIVDGITDRRKSEYKKIQGIVLFDRGMQPTIKAAIAKHPVPIDKPQPSEERGEKETGREDDRGIIPIDKAAVKKSSFKFGLPWLAILIAAAAVVVVSGDKK